MPYYEILYETGAHSVADYADDEEMFAAVGAHHERALSGEKGLDVPGGHNAERVVKVLKYDNHPGEGVEVDAKEVKKLVDEHVTDSGGIDLMSLSEAARTLASPTVESKAHESNYKVEEVKEFTEGWAS